MGAIADAVWAYAQPLLDGTDGSVEDMNRALSISQLCWNIAMLPEEKRDESFRKMRPIVESYGLDFEEFRTSVLDPMVQRHEEMFGQLQRRLNVSSLGAGAGAARVERYPGTDPYAPCPCHSGRKYKFCCRAKT
jgi:hypothetical protein